MERNYPTKASISMRSKLLIHILTFAIVLLGWQYLAKWIDNDHLFPTLQALANELIHLSSTDHFFNSVLSTTLRGCVGIVISLVAALSISIAFVKIPFIKELLSPLIVMMRTIPTISFILLAIIFLNVETIPIVIALLVMFPILCQNLTGGLEKLNSDLTVMAQQFHIGLVNKFTQIIYPQIKPYLFSGLASSMGYGWRAIIMGEVLAMTDFGIGKQLKDAQYHLDVSSLVAWTIVAIGISYIFDVLIKKLSRLNFPILFIKQKSSDIIPSDIVLDNITFSYPERSILKDYSLKLEKGHSYALLGNSGVGKTTLMSIIGGWRKASKGSISSIQNAAVVFQSPMLINQLNPVQNIMLTLANIYPKQQAQKIAIDILQTVGLGNHLDAAVTHLSYGQQQRVAIARALSFPAEVVLMDEPFKGLQPSLTNQLIDLTLELQRKHNFVFLFITHHMREVEYMQAETICLNEVN